MPMEQILANKKNYKSKKNIFHSSKYLILLLLGIYYLADKGKWITNKTKIFEVRKSRWRSSNSLLWKRYQMVVQNLHTLQMKDKYLQNQISKLNFFLILPKSLELLIMIIQSVHWSIWWMHWKFIYEGQRSK